MLSKTVSHSTSGSYFTQCTYANGQVICKFYDKYDRLIKLSEGVNGQVLAKFIYSDEAVADTVTDPTDTSLVISGSSKLRVVIDTTTNTRTTYHYDNLGVLTKVQNQNITITQLEKQADDDWDKKVEYSLGGDKITTAYKYVSEINNSLQSEDTQFNSLEKISTSYTKDNLQRLTETKVMRGDYGYKTTISYAPRQTKKWVSDGFTPIIKPTAVDLDTDLPPITGHWEITDVGTTQYVSSFQEYSISGTTETLVRTDAIEYDANGNITKYGDVTYEYDNLGRLVRENNPNTGIDKTIIWSYDIGGNILSRTEYAYATGDLTGVTPTNTYTYTYGNSWKDQLTSYNGSSIVYDNAGNPTNYKGATLTWTRGRLLASYKASGGSYTTTMQYDANGIRKQKLVPSAYYTTTTNYLYSGNNLLRETIVQGNAGQVSTKHKTYLYNSQGVIGFVYQGETYTYRKNLFGDIIAIYQGNTKVAEYAYDAWGNCTVTNLTSSKIGSFNPFRYRGYYWDEDLQLYYLMSRYYNPTTGRFINADTLNYLDPESINGLNLYAYCYNNPVMYADPIGHFAIGTFLIGLAVSWLISSVASYYLGEHLVSGASSIYGGAQTIATGISLLAYGPVGWILGGVAIALGAINIAFGTAELQQHFTGNNWINDIGITGDLYTGLYVGSSIASTVVSISGTAYMNSSAGKLAHEIQQNAKYWDKGTFTTRYGSLKYHHSKHANGLTPTQYTQLALDFSAYNSSSFKYTYNYNYGNTSWYFNNMYNVGGHYTSSGKIITFWF